ncbi:MAG TPA: UDP-4-amino-4,6-dideoxy-N-acetyl-beta-L-altrosamine transaminase [Steroidobacteraceae bacterium]|nr:UDP-4-amino-4,6-dideoxy-N-acetyl-beta-L-altrosamine transaminase [Steroidobacteraceae bacterium]
MIPYGRQLVDDEDIRAVADVLRSDWLTTGPQVRAFEDALAGFCGARHAVAVSSGTAALHSAMKVLGVGPGDEVIIPAMTFVATANAVLFEGGTPVFSDVDPATLLLDPKAVEGLVTPRTKAVVAVDYAGQPCDYQALSAICRRHGLALVADSCHALGAQSNNRMVGTLADLTAFSFHPVKHITTGEGGMVVTNRDDLVAPLRRFRNHGISTDHRERAEAGTWQYEMLELGYNYRMTDFQCALGISQLRKLPAWLERRRAIARRYATAFESVPEIRLLDTTPGTLHAFHLYVVRLRRERLRSGRAAVFSELRSRGIGVNVHYLPVHLHAYYRTRFGTGPGMFPQAEAAYEEILSLPMHAGLTDAEVDNVIAAVRAVVGELTEH